MLAQAWSFAGMSLLFLILCSFFTLTSAAIVQGRLGFQRELVKSKYLCGRVAHAILLAPEGYLALSRVCYLICALAAGMFLSRGLYAMSEPFGLHAIANGWAVSRTVGWSLFALVELIVALSINEAAKGVGAGYPVQVLCLVSLPMAGLHRLLAPLVYLAEALAGVFSRALRVQMIRRDDTVVSAEELSEIVELSGKAGEINDQEREIIQRVCALSETIVREVMVPRKDVIAVEESAPLQDAVEIFLKERASRILVTGPDLDDVKGVLMAKDLLPFVGKNEIQAGVSKLMRPACFVSNSKRIQDLLQQFRRDGVHFAVVLDEHGGVDGVITFEDLIEEIIGDVFDEYDKPSEEVDIHQTKTGDLIVDGSMLIDDLNAAHQLGIPTGEYDTIAGYMIHRLDRIPAAGESVEYLGMILRIEQVEQNRIISVRISLPERAEESGGDPRL